MLIPMNPKAPSLTTLVPLRLNHALLDPGQLSDMAEEAAHDLMTEGESSNTRASYRTAMRYWAAWFGARYGRQMDLPVPVPVVVQFIVDHAERSTKAGLVHQLPPEIDAALVEAGPPPGQATQSVHGLRGEGPSKQDPQGLRQAKRHTAQATRIDQGAARGGAGHLRRLAQGQA